MASRITVQAPASGGLTSEAAEGALDISTAVESACTRFVATSPLMRANARPNRWHRVPPLCLAAIREAHRAYVMTDGRFDPRVHDVLVSLGYDHSFPSDGTEVTFDGRGAEVTFDGRGAAGAPTAPPGSWRPRWSPRLGLVHLGGSRIDLGGIGKGLAVRWMAERLAEVGEDFLIEAGGDCYASGGLSPREPWYVGVESASGDDRHVAVIGLRDMAVATSSIRFRHWRVGPRQVHHLIDARTAQPAHHDVASVTVVHGDPATAEVWSKALFVSGPERMAAEAENRRLAVLWIDRNGALGYSQAMRSYLVWVGS